jgi:hypothetical protein
MAGARGQCPRCHQLVSIEAGVIADHTATLGIEPLSDARCPGSGQLALPASARETR